MSLFIIATLVFGAVYTKAEFVRAHIREGNPVRAYMRGPTIDRLFLVLRTLVVAALLGAVVWRVAST